MKSLLEKIRSHFSRRTWITLIIVFAALLLELFSTAQYYYTKRILEEELEKKASIEITMKAILVKSMLNTTEQVLNSYMVELTKFAEDTDDIDDAICTIAQANHYFKGVGLAFKPGYFDGNNELFEPWGFNSPDGVEFKENIASRENHDYTNYKFYSEPMATGKPYWSDPYVDTVETHSFITTYSIPIIDKKGSRVGIAGIDLSLEWLNDTLNNRHIYPSSFCMLLTDSGTLISQPSKSHHKHKDFDDAVRLINDPKADKRIVTNSKINVIEFVTEDGQDACVFFHHMKGKPHWQVAVVCYDKEVFGELYKMQLRTGLLMLLGFLLLGYIIYRFLKNNKRMAQNELEHERLNTELHVAQRIQSEMLPKADIEHENIDIAGMLVAAREVGGDIYDYFVRDEKLFFCIGDASGKGVPSALVMSVTHSLFRAIGARESNPARIMQLINHAVCEGNESSMFVTFFIGVLDLPTGRLHYCNAGHDTPLMITDQVHKLDVKPNLPLAVMGDWQFERQDIQLEPGNTFMLYTDGLTEAMNAHKHQFGMERVLNIVKSSLGSSPQELLDSILNGMHYFVGEAEQSDDLTMLAIKYTPSIQHVVLEREITVTNDVEQVTRINDFVDAVCADLKMHTSEATQMRLAVEEAAVNVINYAYPEGETGTLNVKATATESVLKFVLTDSGMSFAPTDAPDVDTSLSAEDRRIGGLGIFLVRQLMDTINYERIDGHNVLTLTKKLTYTTTD